EVGSVRFPIIRVARHLDRLVGLVLDEFEWPGADRMAAHLASRNVAWINRRIARREQRDQGRLGALQMEGCFAVATSSDTVVVVEPTHAEVGAKFFLRL